MSFVNYCQKFVRVFRRNYPNYIIHMNMKRGKVTAAPKKMTTQMKCCASSESQKRQTFEVLTPPVKSLSDKKEYKVIRLKNGLTACLICDFPCLKNLSCSDDEDEYSESESSDTEGEDEENEVIENDEDFCDKRVPHKISEEEQKMAAAALCVGVGSFSDPKNVQGLAHFLEHMVFMGSEKFPEENDFDSFIKKKGGFDNASTDAETTTFYFKCLEKHLCKGLDKFAQFFISPLMKRSSMSREREAIESEFQTALPSNSYKKEQLLCSFAKAESPVNGFTWGNLISLKENISDDELYERVHEFRKRHYSAHRMTLAVQARLPMKMLESYVVDCFSNVPNNKLPPEDLKSLATEVFDTSEFYKMYYVKSTKDLYQVDLTWALPSLLHKYRTKPHQYVSWLLGYEGKGSILSYLRKKVWALNIYTGNSESGMEHNSLYAFFIVSIVLTKEGMDNLSEVIEAVFSYLNMLKKVGPQERIFNEMKSIEDIAFRFAEEETAVEFVEDLVESMQYYPPEDYITGSELYFEYDPEGIKAVMDHLVPEKVNILILSTEPPEGVIYTKKEKWFRTEYAEKEIPKKWIKRWKQVKPYSDFTLPEPNPYLTENFTIMSDGDTQDEYPQKIVSTEGLEIWFKMDQKFKLPVAYYYLYLISPYVLESPVTLCMIDILVNLLVLDLTEDIYPATTAGLSFFMATNDRGVLLKCSGYNDKLPVLIELIGNHIKSFKDNMKIEVFSAVKDKLTKNYQNQLLKPSVLATQVRLGLLLSNYWSHIDRVGAIQEVTFDKMKQFSTDFFNRLHIKALVQGNVSQSCARGVIEKFVQMLDCQPLINNTYPQYRVVQIPEGEHCIRVKSFNKKDSNCIITNYYQSGAFSLDIAVKTELLLMMIEEPLFDVLRTKEQLGYDVSCSQRDTYGVIGHTITVNSQATKFSTHHVDSRIEEFLNQTQTILNNLSAKKFAQFKRNLKKIKQNTDVHLLEEVDRNWSEITADDYMFDRQKKEIQALDNLSLNQLREWWNSCNKFGSKTNFRKLSIQVVGYDTKKGEKETDTSSEELQHKYRTLELILSDNKKSKADKQADYFIKNINDFKSNLFLYPAASVKKLE